MKLGKRLVVIYVLLIGMLTFSLFRLYVISGSETAKQALSGQYARKLEICKRRGFIYDRNGNILNARKDGYIGIIDPSGCENPKSCADTLSVLSGQAESQITEKFLSHVPFTLRLSNEFESCGVRCFPLYAETDGIAVHVVGYTNSDGKGVSGAQKGFESYLGKVFGGSVSYSYSADASGRVLDGTGSTLTDLGYSERSGVVLTLDEQMQKYCEKTAKEHMTAGAVCISDVETGEILCSVSLPDFRKEDVAELLESTKGELINRCARGFTPGSIFKTVVAAAALEYDERLFNLEFQCTGKYVLSDGREFSCHNKSGHGKLSMSGAYAQSCNPYFINLALNTGIDKVLETAKKMGLGENRSLYGICSYGNALPEFRNDDGFAANIAIGQGKLLVSPYEAAAIYSCAASGFYCEPYAVKKIFRSNSTLHSQEAERVRVLSDSTCAYLREMMLECVENGLGKSARPENGNAGGKTATAQTGQYRDGKELLNTWFCGIYPLSEPKYSITVLCDGSGEGGDAKAVFRKICEMAQELTAKSPDS